MDNWKEFAQRYTYCYLEMDYESDLCKDFRANNEKKEILKILGYVKDHADEIFGDKKMIKTVQKEFGMKSPKLIFESLRYAFTGCKIGSSILDIIKVLGKEESLRRIDLAMKYVWNSPCK